MSQENKPEFIDLSHQESYQAFEEHPFREEIPDVTNLEIPFYVRILSFFGGVGLAFWMCVNLLITLFFGFLGMLTLFQNDHANELVKRYWKRVCRFAAISLGLFTAVFSPKLGIVVIITYFMINNEDWQKGPLGTILHTHYRKV